MSAIFLSASVPVPGRGTYHETADPLLIQFAVSALVTVVLGRALLVWGGHPAITPMVRAAAQDLDVNFTQWVHLYQSRYFEGRFPDDNAAFANVTYTDAIANDREQSLETMRRAMIGAHPFTAAVVIGGMDGAEREAELFAEIHPHVPLIPVAATGGAALVLHQRLPVDEQDTPSINFTALFYHRLGIHPKDPRSTRSADPAPRPPVL